MRNSRAARGSASYFCRLRRGVCQCFSSWRLRKHSLPERAYAPPGKRMMGAGAVAAVERLNRSEQKLGCLNVKGGVENSRSFPCSGYMTCSPLLMKPFMFDCSVRGWPPGGSLVHAQPVSSTWSLFKLVLLYIHIRNLLLSWTPHKSCVLCLEFLSMRAFALDSRAAMERDASPP